jgi:putative tricarboxylic transport membrane protein
MWRVPERAGDVAAAIILCGLGLYWVAAAWGMPSGEFNVPGPGFVPALVGSLLAVAALALGGKALASRAGARAAAVGHRHIWGTLLAILAASWAFERAGFVPTVAAFIAFLLWMLSSLRWWAALAAGVVGSATVFLFFSRLLGIRLPAGPWM